MGCPRFAADLGQSRRRRRERFRPGSEGSAYQPADVLIVPPYANRRQRRRMWAATQRSMHLPSTGRQQYESRAPARSPRVAADCYLRSTLQAKESTTSTPLSSMQGRLYFEGDLNRDTHHHPANSAAAIRPARWPRPMTMPSISSRAHPRVGAPVRRRGCLWSERCVDC